MILLIAIILFIIFLIYSIKPRSEGYTLEGLKLSWKNKASIEGNVTKWIVILKDKSGTKIHEYENSDAGNLKDFTDVTMNTVNKKEFDNRIIGDNTLELYYNKVSSDTKLYTKTVTFTEEDFGVTIDTSKLEEIDIDCVGKYVKVKKITPLKVTNDLRVDQQMTTIYTIVKSGDTKLKEKKWGQVRHVLEKITTLLQFSGLQKLQPHLKNWIFIPTQIQIQIKM